MSGLVDNNKDFARGSHWKVLSEGVTWTNLCLKKLNLAVLWKTGKNESREIGTSLSVQWLRLRLPTQGVRV